jgi:MFS transporter, DHA1 family, multidrug resistance protein
MLRFVARVLIARQHDLCRGVFDWGSVDLVAVQTRFPVRPFGLMISNFNALAMEPQGRIAGTASSLYGSITTLLGTGIGTKMGQGYDGTLLPFATGFLLCTLASLAVILVVKKGRLFKPHHIAV